MKLKEKGTKGDNRRRCDTFGKSLAWELQQKWQRQGGSDDACSHTKLSVAGHVLQGLRLL